MTNAATRIKLLEMQVEALRSVLSEFEGDKSHYTQMVAADAFAAALLSLKYETAISEPKSTVKCVVRFNVANLDTHAAYDPYLKRYTAVRDGVIDIQVRGTSRQTPPLLNNSMPVPMYDLNIIDNRTSYRANVTAGDTIDFPFEVQHLNIALN